jgi:hypothetical protein
MKNKNIKTYKFLRYLLFHFIILIKIISCLTIFAINNSYAYEIDCLPKVYSNAISELEHKEQQLIKKSKESSTGINGNELINILQEYELLLQYENINYNALFIKLQGFYKDLLAPFLKIDPVYNFVFCEENSGVIEKFDKLLKQCISSKKFDIKQVSVKELYASPYYSYLRFTEFYDIFERLMFEKIKKTLKSSDYTNTASAPKIPKKLHHIWLTNKNIHKEITKEDIEYILLKHKILLQEDETWEHILWTNDKTLIPESVRTLEANGIKIQELSEIDVHPRLIKNIKDIVDAGQWLVATDIFRYIILEHFGGVYTDVNFIFYENAKNAIKDILRDCIFCVNENKENNFIASVANHPVLTLTLEIIDEGFNNPPGFQLLHYLLEKQLDVSGKINFSKFDIKRDADYLTWETYKAALRIISKFKEYKVTFLDINFGHDIHGYTVD